MKWADTAPNTVVTVGKNVALDAYLAGNAYTVVGPYMGLISGSVAPVVSLTDTMASHGGWVESGSANAPTYTVPRKTTVWSSAAAGVKSLSTPLVFSMTGSGTVAGCFLVYSTSASTLVDNTSGTLFSAGLFTGGNKVVANLDVLNVSYSVTM